MSPTTCEDITVVVTHAPTELRRPMLQRALDSVWRQTLQPAQVTVSVDTRREGAASTRERGTLAVATPLVAYLDDDDEMYPGHLRVLRDALVAYQADLVFPWFDVVGGTDPFPQYEGRPWDNEHPTQIPVTYLARTERIVDAGGWIPDVDLDNPGTDPEGNRAGEDWNLVLRLVRSGARIVHIPVRTWVWWHHGTNSSGLPSRVR